MNFVNILLWAFTIFLEGKTGRSSQARDSSGMYIDSNITTKQLHVLQQYNSSYFQ